MTAGQDDEQMRRTCPFQGCALPADEGAELDSPRSSRRARRGAPLYRRRSAARPAPPRRSSAARRASGRWAGRGPTSPVERRREPGDQRGDDVGLVGLQQGQDDVQHQHRDDGVADRADHLGHRIWRPGPSLPPPATFLTSPARGNRLHRPAIAPDRTPSGDLTCVPALPWRGGSGATLGPRAHCFFAAAAGAQRGLRSTPPKRASALAGCRRKPSPTGSLVAVVARAPASVPIRYNPISPAAVIPSRSQPRTAPPDRPDPRRPARLERQAPVADAVHRDMSFQEPRRARIPARPHLAGHRSSSTRRSGARSTCATATRP